jgi:MoaA/NifB/PqqE/SkfB family radical SAM enzyme
MKKIQSYIGISKALVNLRVKISVFLFITGLLLKGEVKISKYVRVLRRLLYFLSKMKHNKYVKIGADIKMNLYVPAYPSKAFYYACRKMLEFDKKMPCVTVLVSVTSACKYHCRHCYQKYDLGKDLDVNTLVDTIKQMQKMGIAFFNIEGGEPFLVYDKLLKVCKAIDQRSEIIINTTGDSVTLERLIELKSLKNVTALMFSLHSSTAEGLNEFTGNKNAWDNMVNAIYLSHKAGVGVTFNSCLQSQSFSDGTFEKIMDVAKGFNATLIQLIKPKPSGGWLESGVKMFSNEDVKTLKEKVNSYNQQKKYKDYPFVYSQLMEEETEMFGCTAGGTDRFYLNAKGDIQPCEFLNISFGNIHSDNFDTIYKRMRETFQIPGDCWLCEQNAKDIFKLFKESNAKSLPLSTELSEKIYKNWKRGNVPDFYAKMNKL